MRHPHCVWLLLAVGRAPPGSAMTPTPRDYCWQSAEHRHAVP